jgi:hypothetical protein
MQYSCAQPDETYTVTVLLISHIVTAAISIVYEISTIKGWFSAQAFCEIIRIPSYFYVIMYAGSKDLIYIHD